MRTIVNLPPEAVGALDEHCRRERISRSEGIRRAVDGYLRDLGVPGEDAFGLWRDRDEDGRACEDRLRAEWGEHAGGG